MRRVVGVGRRVLFRTCAGAPLQAFEEPLPCSSVLTSPEGLMNELRNFLDVLIQPPGFL